MWMALRLRTNINHGQLQITHRLLVKYNWLVQMNLSLSTVQCPLSSRPIHTGRGIASEYWCKYYVNVNIVNVSTDAKNIDAEIAFSKSK